MREIIMVVLLLFLGIVERTVFASLMRKAAAMKGHGDKAHAWAMCFWLGLIGGIYVIALPDLIQQNQNQQIIELSKGNRDNHDKV